MDSKFSYSHLGINSSAPEPAQTETQRITIIYCIGNRVFVDFEARKYGYSKLKNEIWASIAFWRFTPRFTHPV